MNIRVVALTGIAFIAAGYDASAQMSSISGSATNIVNEAKQGQSWEAFCARGEQ